MSVAVASTPIRREWYVRTAVAVGVVAVAVLTGLALGDPSPAWWLPLAALGGAFLVYAGICQPFTSLLVILGSNILLVVVRVGELGSISLIDALLPLVLLASWFGRARADAQAHPEIGESHARLRSVERRFVRAVVVFYVAAALSLLQLARLAGVAAALDSALILTRAFQALLLFPLCSWWLRTPDRVAMAWRAMFASGVALAVTNLIGISFWGVRRAGMTLYLNNPDAPFACPNEAGTATLVVGVVLLVRHAMRPDWKNLVLGALMLLLLGLTMSRSGLLAWATFGLLTLRRVPPSRLLAGALSVAALLPLLPGTFWTRMARTITVERGTFEAFSFYQRVLCWRVAWSVVLDHPFIGVGYLGFRFVSPQYNELRMVLGTVENYYYEILVSMGVVGLALLGWVIVRLFQLGREVGRVAPPGTLAHHMSRYHTPLVLGLLVANLTGDNFMGMVSLAQLALWTAVLVRSGHAAVAQGPRPADARPPGAPAIDIPLRPGTLA